jgi:hypothetical protein
MATQHFMLLQRNLVYTGVTRGKRLVVLIGPAEGAGNGGEEQQDGEPVFGAVIPSQTAVLRGGTVRLRTQRIHRLFDNSPLQSFATFLDGIFVSASAHSMNREESLRACNGLVEYYERLFSSDFGPRFDVDAWMMQDIWQVWGRGTRLHSSQFVPVYGQHAYYGITGNGRCLTQVCEGTKKLWHKWLNRRSNAPAGMTWERFRQVVRVQFVFPFPRVIHSIYRAKP